MEFKTCRTCNKELPLSNFNVLTRLKKSGIKYQCDCTVCRSEARRNKARRVKAEAIAYKGGKCNDCNQVVHQAAFEFHHIDPSTKAAKSATSKQRKEPTHYLQNINRLNETAKLELDKCVLLCANCHRVRHFSDLI